MACGVALKRSLDFDPLHNVNPSVSCDETVVTPAKRRRYSIPQRCGSVTPVTSTPPLVSPSVWRRYVPSANESLSNGTSTPSPFTHVGRTGVLSSGKLLVNLGLL